MSAKRGTASKRGRRPLLVGLTGNFGTGKSTVARFFRKKGARILSADRLAHEVFGRGNPLYPRVRSLFPELKGDLSRARIAEIIFRDSKRRRALESRIHPYVFRRIREEVGRTRGRILVLEVPLLFESGFHRSCDRTVVVRARESDVFKRLRRKGYGKHEINARWKAQMPLAIKAARADYVIDNSNGIKKTAREAQRVWQDLQI